MMHALIAGHGLPSKSQKALPDVGGTTNKTTTTTATAKQLTEKERIKAVLPKFVLVPRKSYSPLCRSPLAPPSKTPARMIPAVDEPCDPPIENRVAPSRLRDITNANASTPIANSKSIVTKIFVDEQRLAVKMRIRRQRKFDDEDLRRHALRVRMAHVQDAARCPPPPPPQAEQVRGRPTTRTRLSTFPIPEKYSRRKDFGKPWAQRKAEILGENLPLAPFFR